MRSSGRMDGDRASPSPSASALRNRRSAAEGSSVPGLLHSLRRTPGRTKVQRRFLYIRSCLPKLHGKLHCLRSTCNFRSTPSLVCCRQRRVGRVMRRFSRRKSRLRVCPTPPEMQKVVGANRRIGSWLCRKVRDRPKGSDDYRGYWTWKRFYQDAGRALGGGLFINYGYLTVQEHHGT